MPLDTTTYLDLRGLKCPLPVLRTRKLLGKLEDGARLIVECTDPLSVIDIPHLVRMLGDVLELNVERDGIYVFHIRRGAAMRQDAPNQRSTSMINDPAQFLAALVFETSDEVNGVMAEFAAALAARGHRLAGCIQVSANTQGCGCPQTHVLDLESGARIPILQDLGTHAQACRADSAALADVAGRARQALERRPDLLIINRFGRLESEGKGMRDEIAAAATADIPVLVGVASRYLEAWRGFALGLDEELACTRTAVDDWWQRLDQCR